VARKDKVVLDTLSLKSGKYVTTTGCKVIFPTRYRSKNLASFGDYTEVLSVFKMVLPDGTYGIARDVSRIRLARTSYSIEKIDDEDMYVFSYNKGDAVIDSTDIIVDKLLPYYTYEYLIDKGYVPSFLEYDDMMLMWENVKHSTGNKVGSTKEIIRFIISLIARSPKDAKVFYRQAVNEGFKGKPKWIAFSSVIHGPRTTTAKLIGARFSSALISALNTENTKPEKVEDILRRN
jgi:hypothetical protein